MDLSIETERQDEMLHMDEISEINVHHYQGGWIICSRH